MFVFKKILSGRVFLLLLLLLLYLNFFIEGAVTVVHVVIIVTLLLLAWKILKLRHCEFICYPFLVIGFLCYILSDRDFSVYYSSVFLFGSLFTLYKTANRGMCICLIVIVLFEICYSMFTYFVSRDAFFFFFTFDNPIGFVCFMLCCIPLFLPYFKLYKQLVVGMLVLIFVAICLSGSRIGILAFIMLVSYHFYNYSLKFRGLLRKYKCALLCLFVCLFVVLLYLKFHSANGRLLIWRVCLDIIADNNLFTGIGLGQFKHVYMGYQASFLSAQEDDYWDYLASETQDPFSEYMLIGLEAGVVGVVLLIYFLYYAFKCQNRFGEIVLVIFVCGLVSYPLSFPLLCLFLGFALSSIVPFYLRRRMRVSVFVRVLMIALILMWGSVIAYDIHKETMWKNLRLAEQSDDGLFKYRCLYKDSRMRKNPYFLHDYGMYLLSCDHMMQGIRLLNEAAGLTQNYKLELLVGDAYKNAEAYDEAEEHYLNASRMCPNRFIPLYKLFVLYRQNNIDEKALEVAYNIVTKRVKVDSTEVRYIILKARMYIRAYQKNSSTLNLNV